MAYFKITQNKKGELQAKIQVSGKDLSTGKSKVFTKRVYNTDELTEAKFRKQVEKTAIAFEEEVSRAYQDGKTQLRSKVLTFSELMREWKENVKVYNYIFIRSFNCIFYCRIYILMIRKKCIFISKKD